MKNFNKLMSLQSSLATHPLFKELNSLERVQGFMEIHVWAVWDFMSLLKRLQRDLTCVALPWKPSAYPSQVVRLINEIVLGEESDVDQEGNACSHFELYLKAMEEVGADTGPIKTFIYDNNSSLMPQQAQGFVAHTMSLVESGSTVEVAAAFFYGREKVIPGMFEGILSVLKKENIPCPTLNYYLERHIHLDGEEHGPMSEKCLTQICQGEESKFEQAYTAGMKSLEAREEFWDVIRASLVSSDEALDTLQSH